MCREARGDVMGEFIRSMMAPGVSFTHRSVGPGAVLRVSSPQHLAEWEFRQVGAEPVVGAVYIIKQPVWAYLTRRRIKKEKLA